MFVKGTRLLAGEEARAYRNVINKLSEICISANFEEVILPVLATPDMWTTRSGSEIENQMWTFKDKGGRATCLPPEGTAMLQKLYRDQWSKSRPKPIRLFYIMKAFRYERPQAGRYREFTQFGLEILGPNPTNYEDEAKRLLRECLDGAFVEPSYEFDDEVVRGLSYYSRNGFEARFEGLGAQKQIAGGGTYAEGCGWAIGVDRLLLATA